MTGARKPHHTSERDVVHLARNPFRRIFGISNSKRRIHFLLLVVIPAEKNGGKPAVVGLGRPSGTEDHVLIKGTDPGILARELLRQALPALTRLAIVEHPGTASLVLPAAKDVLSIDPGCFRAIDAMCSVGNLRSTELIVGRYLKDHGKAEDARRYLENSLKSAAANEWSRALAAKPCTCCRRKTAHSSLKSPAVPLVRVRVTVALPWATVHRTIATPPYRVGNNRLPTDRLALAFGAANFGFDLTLNFLTAGRSTRAGASAFLPSGGA